MSAKTYRAAIIIIFVLAAAFVVSVIAGIWG